MNPFPALLCRSCKFCKIVEGGTSDTILYKDKNIVAFFDLDPAAETHILIVPVEHIDSVKTVRTDHINLLLLIRDKAHELLRKRGHHPAKSRLGFHIPPFNTVDHLHLHVLGGEFESDYRSTKYEIGREWYMDLTHLLSQLGRIKRASTHSIA